MKNGDRPEMKPIDKGDYLKVLEVHAKAGMNMPMHHATQETVIVVKSGKSVLHMDKKEHEFSAGDTIIIPAMKDHSLSIKEDFIAVVTMPVNGEIKF